MGWRHRYLDDSGEPLARGRPLSGKQARRQGLDEATLAAILEPVERLSGRYGMAVGLVNGVCIMVAFAVLGSLPHWARGAIGLGVGFLALWPVAAWNGRRIDRAWRAAWIDRGLCPACGASIANVPTRGDGLRTCATCDASWRLEPGARLLPVGRVDASHRGAHTRARSPFFGPPIVDDRGRAYTLDRTIPGVIARGHGIDRRRIRAALGFGTPEEMAVVFSAVVIVLVAGMSAQGGLAHAPGWSIAVLVVGVPLLAALLTLTALRPWSARVRRCASRRLCLCAACGRKLDAIEPAEDGCRVCEGCGSAWTIDGSVEGSAS